uniref:Uncharacterized protein n=1 Tax=Panagrellus redivivus TaxID=6233 RepID=A0A7E4WAR8_PANRE
MVFQSIFIGYVAYDLYNSFIALNAGGSGAVPAPSSTTTANVPTAAVPAPEPANVSARGAPDAAANLSARGAPVKSARSATKPATTPRSPTRSSSSKVQKV